MKTRFILITILFSLFFSIGHDFILYEESKGTCVATIQQVDNINDSCCSHIADLHNNFHFLGLLSSESILLLKRIETPLSYKELSSIGIDSSTFKPPRA